MSKYTPFFIDLNGKKCTVAGGGKIAFRKIESLLEAGGNVTCITKEVLEPNITMLSQRGKITLNIKEAELSDFADAFVIVAATNDRVLNHSIYEAFKNKNILINSVDDVGNSNFIYPAILKRGLLKIAVSTSGAAPSLAARIRDKIGNMFDERFESIFDLLKSVREKILNDSILESGDKTKLLKEIADSVNLDDKNNVQNLQQEIEIKKIQHSVKKLK